MSMSENVEKIRKKSAVFPGGNGLIGDFFFKEVFIEALRYIMFFQPSTKVLISVIYIEK